MQVNKEALTSWLFPLQLSFALSILGEPAVMLWDEPSASVDPKGQRCMW